MDKKQASMLVLIAIVLLVIAFVFAFNVGLKQGSYRVWEEIKKGKIECEEKLPRDEYCYMQWSKR